MSKLINRQIVPEIRSIDTEKRTVDFIISTEKVDRHGTSWKLDGWQLDEYRANPVVSYNHFAGSPDPDMIIGTSEIRIEEGKLVATLSLEADNPIADKVLRKLENGTLRSASIGAIIHEGHWGERKNEEDPEVLYFTRQSLLEWSVVSVPSNTEAVKRSAAEEELLKEFPKEEETNRAVCIDHTARYLKVKLKLK